MPSNFETMTTARPLKLYMIVLQKFLCAPEQRSAVLLGLGGVAAVFAGKCAAALGHPSEEGREGWVVPSQAQGGKLQRELVKGLSSGHNHLVPNLCQGWLQDQAKAGLQSQSGKAKALNLSCGGTDFDLCLREWKGLQSTTVQGDGWVPLLWKTAGSCLKWNAWWGSAEHCICSGLCLCRGLFPGALLCVSSGKVQCVPRSTAPGLWDTHALNCGLGKWQGQVHISGFIACLPLS